MLSFPDFFTACAGFWMTERTYHDVVQDEIERSYTEFQVTALDQPEKQRLLAGSEADPGSFSGIKVDLERLMSDPSVCPGFAIAFDTRSETGEQVAMSLKALFMPDAYVTSHSEAFNPMPMPGAAQMRLDPSGEVIQGYYLRDQGYSEAGAIAGRFTYQPTRQTLEMTTYYSRSVAVDQMRFITPELRLRTIVTYQRPTDDSVPTVIDLVGFGLERKRSEASP